MIIIRNDCCGCATATYPCLGNSCPLLHHEIIICDICGAEDACEYDGRDLCEECIRKQYPEEYND